MCQWPFTEISNRQTNSKNRFHIVTFLGIFFSYPLLFRGNLSAPLYLDSSLSHHALTHPALKMIGAMSTLLIARHKTYRSHDLFMANLIILCRYLLIFWLELFLRVLEMDAPFFPSTCESFQLLLSSEASVNINLFCLKVFHIIWKQCFPTCFSWIYHLTRTFLIMEDDSGPPTAPFL